RLEGKPPLNFPQETAIGALALYISGGSVADFQPMNVNFGIIPPLDHRVKGKKEKNTEIAQRGLALLEDLMRQSGGQEE
ncbi:MAG: methylenetetrahydrofolate--tRNA-(uracil(54)-C(5))-methyltransferase (FADH(2)-oxidizing) TrmFO, partial [Pseudoflavonifractor sp.]